jgi:hypothetical protein
MSKTIGDLTLKEVKEVLDRGCPWSCTECKVKHKIDYLLCREDFEFDFDDKLLDKEIEVDEEC